MTGKIIVAAVRREFRWAQSRAAFAAELAELLAQAASEGARLVALPLHTGTALFGLEVAGLSHLSLEAGLAKLVAFDGGERPALVEHGNTVQELASTIFGELATKLSLWLAAGSLVTADENGQFWHQATVFDSHGQVVGRQRATHRSVSEQNWGLLGTSELNLLDTDVGPVGLILGEDVRYPEVSRILSLQGARILVHLSGGGSAGMPIRLAGLWREVQANQVFGIEASLAPGWATIYCPVELDHAGRGLLADSGWGHDPVVVSAALDSDACRDLRRVYDIAGYFNQGWYREVLPKAYGTPEGL